MTCKRFNLLKTMDNDEIRDMWEQAASVRSSVRSIIAPVEVEAWHEELDHWSILNLDDYPFYGWGDDEA